MDHGSNRMPAHHRGLETLAEALLAQGFSKIDEFGLFITYERPDEPLKIYIGLDGTFAGFNHCDQLVAEGEGLQGLYAVLVARAKIAPRSGAPALGTVSRAPDDLQTQATA